MSERNSASECSGPDCTAAVHAKGLCSQHYYLANKARFKENSDRWRKSNPERARELTRESEARHPEKVVERHARHAKPMTDSKRAQMNTAVQSAQTETRAKADRHYGSYTSWELDAISDESRTVREVALDTGRTYKAISRMRSIVRKDARSNEATP